MGEKNQEEKDREKQGKPESVIKEIFSWVFSFTLAFLAAFFVKHYLIINADVPTGSMENTIMPGDRLVGNRLAYWRDDPQRGDVIIFHYPDNEEELFVKRVIGLPGETVVIEEGKIYIDGSEKALPEEYLKEVWTEETGPDLFEVPDDSYLVLGDNRNDSWDARYWSNTYVDKDKILGEAVLIYFPFSHFGKLSD